MTKAASPHDLKSLIEARRAALHGVADPAQGKDWWGLALSGGGIRSATFCLGLTRALARQKQLLRFDLLSTVSGGGYLGATLGRLFDRAPDAQTAVQFERAFGGLEERWCHWSLRNGSRYLTPGGAGDLLEICAIFLRNLLALHLEFALVGLAVGFALLTFNTAVWHAGWGAGLWSSVWGFLLLPAMAAAVLLSAFWASAPERDERRRDSPDPPRWLGLLVVLLLLMLTWPFLAPSVQAHMQARMQQWWPVLAALTALGGAGWWLTRLRLRRLAHRAQDRLPGGRLVAELRSRLRQELGRSLGWLLGVTFSLLLLGLLDRAAWALAFTDLSGAGWTGGALAATVALARVYGPRLGALAPHVPKLLKLPTLWLLEILGLLALAALAVFWVAVAYRAGVQLGPDGTVRVETAWVAAAALLGLSLWQLLSGRRRQFINLSSLHAFYRQRLTRAFLGAANGFRFPAAAPGGALDLVQARRAPRRTTDQHGDDDCALHDYAPHRGGGPVHLINVCANETQHLRGGLSNPDRRGRLMTLAPGGLVRLGLGAWRQLGRGQGLTVGSWMAVSGAALAPGLGSRTRGGVAALLMVLGIRLGLWWNPGVLVAAAPRWHRRLSKAAQRGLPGLARQRESRLSLLGKELLGRFSLRQGPWFLTDGGHIENTGAYALLAQRCRLVVLADCGADPDYRFADLENLVRKARIDLQTEIRFLRPNAAGQRVLPAQIGGLDDIASPDSGACIALARIDYLHGNESGLLVLVKPNVFKGMPVDLQNFKREQPLFPQQGTGDQSFSEEQWESYHQLGDLLGRALTEHQVLDLAARDWQPFLELDTGRRAQRTQAEVAVSAPAARPALAAGVGAGALLTVGLSAWALVDLFKPSPAANEPLLEPLVKAYGQLSSKDETSLASLAARWLLLQEQACQPSPAAAAQALRGSALAQCMLADTRRLCQAQQASVPACQRLLRQPEAMACGPQRPLPRYANRPEPPAAGCPS